MPFAVSRQFFFHLSVCLFFINCWYVFLSVDGAANEKPKQFIIGETVKAEIKGSPERNCKDSLDATTPTPPSQKKKILLMKKDGNHLVSSPSLERLKFKVEALCPATSLGLRPEAYCMH